jgi:hypothetical protein
MTKTVISDGGRAVSGYSAEKLDCAVRALACSLDIPYHQAHEVFKHFGRKDRRGSRNTSYTLKCLGYTPLFDQRGTLDRFIANNPKGRYYIVKAGHAFALVNGQVFDTFDVSGRVRVKWYCKVGE